jgi:hypothetical protein
MGGTYSVGSHRKGQRFRLALRTLSVQSQLHHSSNKGQSQSHNISARTRRKHFSQQSFYCCVRTLPSDGSSTVVYLGSCCLAMAVVPMFALRPLPSNGYVIGHGNEIASSSVSEVIRYVTIRNILDYILNTLPVFMRRSEI